MDKPSKKIIDDINAYLGNLKKLTTLCEGKELPPELRNHGISVLNNLFKPQFIGQNNIEDLNEELHIIDEVLQKKEVLRAVSDWLRASGKDPVILRITEKKTILSKHWKKGDEKSFTEQKPPAMANNQSTSRPDYYIDKNDRLSAYERTDSIVYSRHSYPSYNRQDARKNISIEKLTNQEMRSQYEERRLDASFNDYERRDHGKIGSPSSRDNYDDEAKP
ncbi:MAG: hypothetical protein JWP45_2915 [Mucilaginibacter sp.]|nr:hypothetical protein [Mucilaginibacter sp.]